MCRAAISCSALDTREARLAASNDSIVTPVRKLRNATVVAAIVIDNGVGAVGHV